MHFTAFRLCTSCISVVSHFRRISFVLWRCIADDELRDEIPAGPDFYQRVRVANLRSAAGSICSAALMLASAGLLLCCSAALLLCSAALLLASAGLLVG